MCLFAGPFILVSLFQFGVLHVFEPIEAIKFIFVSICKRTFFVIVIPFTKHCTRLATFKFNGFYRYHYVTSLLAESPQTEIDHIFRILLGY